MSKKNTDISIIVDRPTMERHGKMKLKNLRKLNHDLYDFEMLRVHFGSICF